MLPCSAYNLSKIGPQIAHACSCVRRPQTDNEQHNGPGCAISWEVVMPTVQKSPALDAGKRFGPEENSYWARALPGGPSLLLTFCYIIIHVRGGRKKPVLFLKLPSRPADQSGGSYQCVQAGKAAWQRLGVKFFGGDFSSTRNALLCEWTDSPIVLKSVTTVWTLN